MKQPKRTIAVFLLPSLIGVSIFYVLPFAEMVRLSFFDASGQRHVGLQNYTDLLQNNAFSLAVQNTARFIGCSVPLLLGFALLAALLLNVVRHGAKPLRALLLLPYVLPVSVIALLWQALFGSYGAVFALFPARADMVSTGFLETGAVFWLMLATYLWKNGGFQAVLIGTGLSDIPQSQYEAAAIDGAGSWMKFWRITLPSLLPTLALSALLGLINCFKIYRESYLVSGEYPDTSIYLLQHLLNNWFDSLAIHKLSAAAVFLLLVCFWLALGVRKLWQRKEGKM